MINSFVEKYISVFNSCKYSKWYFNIIRGALSRPDNDQITEKHHIIPDCLFINRKRKGPRGSLPGNPNDKLNFVDLTIKEHVLCHLLLTKMFSSKRNKNKMLVAFESVCLRRHVPIKLTVLHRSQMSKINRGMVVAKNIATNEIIHVEREVFDSDNNLVGVAKGNIWTEEQRKTFIAAVSKPQSIEHKTKRGKSLSTSLKNNPKELQRRSERCKIMNSSKAFIYKMKTTKQLPENREKQRLLTLEQSKNKLSRQCVKTLKELTKTYKIALGRGWWTKSDDWIQAKISEISDYV